MHGVVMIKVQDTALGPTEPHLIGLSHQSSLSRCLRRAREYAHGTGGVEAGGSLVTDRTSSSEDALSSKEHVLEGWRKTGRQHAWLHLREAQHPAVRAETPGPAPEQRCPNTHC